ncbi:MAG: porin [Coprobacter sp.]|nr:porin [Coprobacter sp.]
MKPMQKIVSCMLIIVLTAGTVSAQTDTMLVERVSTNEKEITKLKKIVSKLPRISGFINFRYQYSDKNGGSNSFDVRRARLDFKGNISTKVDYRLFLEFSGTPKVLDAYVRWKIDRRVNVQVGEFKIPFSLENTYGPTTLETIDNSMAISKLCNYSDLSGMSANGRDIGIGLYGGFLPRDGYNIVDYAIGVFNGNGINISDNNKAKDFSGRLNINPLRSLTLSASYYYGRYKKSGATYSIDRERVAAGAQWVDNKWLVRSEYLYGKTADTKSEGVYAVVGYYVHPQVQPLLKYDYFKSDKALDSSRESDFTVGLNYSPIKWIRLQANYTYKLISGSDNVNYLALQLFAIF